MYLCLEPVLASLVSQLGLYSASQPISSVFRLVVFSFLLGCISIPASECYDLAFFATTVACFASFGVRLGVPLGHLHFGAYAKG